MVRASPALLNELGLGLLCPLSNLSACFLLFFLLFKVLYVNAKAVFLFSNIKASTDSSFRER
jgi:hypothetical protein